MKELVGILTLALFHASYATLSIKGPTQPVLRYERAVLDCLVSGPELNLSQVHFEFRKKSLWTELPDEDNRFMGRCWWPWRALFSHREEGRLFVDGPMTEHHSGSYRCVSDAGNASEILNITVHYMENVVMRQSGFLRGHLGSVMDLKVAAGGSVELECSSRSSVEPEYQWSKEGVDWILPSSKLKLQDIQVREAGNYTCVAKHPIMDSLIKSRTISITVLPESASWWQSSDGYLLLMASGTVLALLLLIVTMSAALCRRRAKLASISKGPIDDHSEKKPIYKGSAESLPSTCEDNQPLV